MPWYTGLARVARRTGYPVVEHRNWKNNGHRAMSGCEAIIVHHDVSNPRGGNAPLLDYIYNNKLSHYQLGRDGTIYVTGAGLMGHAGKDSQVSPAHARNAYSIGIEAANNGTGEPWPDRQMDAYVKLCRALIDEFKLPVSRVYGHKEVARPHGRKIDPTFNMTTFRNAVQRGYWTTKTTTPAKASTPSKPKGTLSVSDVNKIMSELNKKASANQVNQVFVRQREYQNETLELIDSRASKSMVNSVFVRQREYQAELEEMIRQLAEATGTEIDYDKVREAAKTGAKEALAEGIDIEAEVTFHSPDEDQGE